jgi:hypothetical protein
MKPLEVQTTNDPQRIPGSLPVIVTSLLQCLQSVEAYMYTHTVWKRILQE